ncbi:nitrous oxide reductase family maturation protein NosD [Kordia sp. YSTF-M3]|uniref:Nitrous oxide reductase family maturation protein NosD n=1 Tax=Kordia aestuariivivens TaxID=2759037 RepID=A0ABR7Q477_9FLAO|nr:nitrous oxide reductase family maturation protein NosD [Kordia aestuariivivens]MBC8753347.1 nitrous oxide reductase family maturation protein NosD [Kordia aestuariivivens]
MDLLKKLLFTLVLFCSFSITAQTIEVCNDCDVSSLKEAIKVSTMCDTILVKKGTYKEYNIVVDKPLTIIGENFPVIDGEDKGEIIRIVSDYVTIDGLFIINVGTSYTSDHAAIRVVRSKHFVIQNVVLENLFFGIYIEKSSHGKIYHNKVIGDAQDEYNSGNGIQLWHSKHILVERNIVQKVRDGIYLEFSDDITINENTSTNNLRYGLHFMFSNDDLYTNNVFENNGAGVAVMFSKRIKMLHNTFKKNWGTAAFGLLLKEINDAEIKHNVFEENTVAINIEGSNRVVYSDNDFISNGYAIKVLGACYANTFEKNNFLYNSFDVSYYNKINDNVFQHNYWSGYTGYDLDEDGVGDVPYRPVKLFSYIVNKTPETIILMRSLFIDIIDFSEKVSPVFTPDNLLDMTPQIKRYQ